MSATLIRLPVSADTYESDYFAWTQQQAARLRACRNATGLDTEHLAQEIEDLGKSDERQVYSLAQRIIEHLSKIAALPGHRSAKHWRVEVRGFRQQLRRVITTSLRAKLESALDSLHDDAAELVNEEYGVLAASRYTLVQIEGDYCPS